jgi:hypothetical protein
MADILLTKSRGALFPATEEAAEWMQSIPNGDTVRGQMTRPRNIAFHRKFFALLNVSYNNWPRPEIETPYGPATCSRDKFRNDVIVLAGHGEPECNVKGEWRMKAKSIAFASMDEDEFGRLYNDTLNVILEKFLPNWTGDEMENAVSQVLAFG